MEFEAHLEPTSLKKQLEVKARDVVFAIKPSEHILREANKFIRTLNGPFIGVQAREEKIFKTHNISPPDYLVALIF